MNAEPRTLPRNADVAGQQYISRAEVAKRQRRSAVNIGTCAGTNKLKQLNNMLYLRLIIGGTILLALIYYIMLVGQCFGLWKITMRELTFSKMCIPFYYWIVSQKP